MLPQLNQHLWWLLSAELYRNNVFGGTAFSCYGGFWLSYGIFGMLVSSGVFAAPTEYGKGIQMFLIIWGEELLSSSFPSACLLYCTEHGILWHSLDVRLPESPIKCLLFKADLVTKKDQERWSWYEKMCRNSNLHILCRFSGHQYWSDGALAVLDHNLHALGRWNWLPPRK